MNRPTFMTGFSSRSQNRAPRPPYDAAADLLAVIRQGKAFVDAVQWMLFGDQLSDIDLKGRLLPQAREAEPGSPFRRAGAACLANIPVRFFYRRSPMPGYRQLDFGPLLALHGLTATIYNYLIYL
jgi:hypothetical protein